MSEENEFVPESPSDLPSEKNEPQEQGVLDKKVSRRQFGGGLFATLASRYLPHAKEEHSDELDGVVQDSPRKGFSRRDLLRGNFDEQEKEEVHEIQTQEEPSFLDSVGRTIAESSAMSAVNAVAFGIQNATGRYDEFKQEQQEYIDSGGEITPFTFSEVMTAPLPEEALFRLLPYITTDVLTRGLTLESAKTVGGHLLFGGAFNDSATQFVPHLTAGFVSTVIDVGLHARINRRTPIDGALQAVNSGYRYWLTGARGGIHPIISHAVNNAIVYPFYKMTLPE